MSYNEHEEESLPETRLLEPNEQIGSYRILGRIGGGAFGAVYKVEHTILERYFALKQLRPSVANREDIEQRFLREARLLGLLSHPNIVQIVDCQHHPGIGWCLMMEWLFGCTLDVVLRRGPLSAFETYTFFHQLCSALHIVHQHGVIHRDLKPSNLFLSRKSNQFHLRLMDFGISSSSNQNQDEHKLTVVGQMLGSFLYMSPEQAYGQHEIVDTRSDIYSLGILLAETLTGRTPFQGGMPSILLKHIQEPPPPLKKLAPHLLYSTALEEVYQRALAKKPEDRFPSVAAFWQALHHAFQLEQIPSPAPKSGRIFEVLSEIHDQLSPKEHASMRSHFQDEMLQPPPHFSTSTPFVKQAPQATPLPNATQAPQTTPPPRTTSSSSNPTFSRKPSAYTPIPKLQEANNDTTITPITGGSKRPPATPHDIFSAKTPPPSRSGAFALFSSFGTDRDEKASKKRSTQVSVPPPSSSPTPPPPSSSTPPPSSPTPSRAARLVEQGFEALRSGQREKAKQLWEEALRHDPENKTIQNNLKRLQDTSHG
ncbi:serine/threonine protein kinase [Myxococcota bacterium]|nr:serine/threonine protein kinase [Myxococcota bacterium]